MIAQSYLLNFLASRFCIWDAASVPAGWTVGSSRFGRRYDLANKVLGAKLQERLAQVQRCCRMQSMRLAARNMHFRKRAGRTGLEAGRDSKACGSHHHGACRREGQVIGAQVKCKPKCVVWGQQGRLAQLRGKPRQWYPCHYTIVP